MAGAALGDSLKRLEAALAQRSAPIMGHFRPRRPADDVAEVLAHAGLPAHADLITWFGWHDGTDTPSAAEPPAHLLAGPDNRLIGPRHLLSLDLTGATGQAGSVFIVDQALGWDPDAP